MGLENTNTTDENLDNASNNKGGKNLLIGIIILFVIFAGGFAYNHFSDSPIKNPFSKIGNTSEEQINYLFNVKGDFSGNFTGVSGSGNIEMQEGKIFVGDNGLKQKFSLGNLNANSFVNGMEFATSLENLDIISSQEKVYLLLENGLDKFSSSLIKKTKENSSSGVYTMIDNSKPILELIGELGQNEVIKELVLGATTSNAGEYYSRNGTYEKLLEALKKDDFLDYLFVEGEKDETTGKTSLTLNENICTDYGPIVSKLMGQDESFLDEIIGECNESINSTNRTLLMFSQIYKEGDIENGDFQFVIASGNIFDLNIDYKNHYIDSWNIVAKNIDETILFKVSGNSEELLSSTLKVIYENPFLNINGEIVDGNGDINISGDFTKIMDSGNVSGKISFSDYKLVNYDINGSFEDGDEISGTLKASGTMDSGEIVFDASIPSNMSSLDNIAFNFKYDNKEKIYNFEYDSDYFDLKSDYNAGVFAFDGNITSPYLDEKLFEASLSVDSGDIKGKFYSPMVDLNIDGEYNNNKDFYLNLTENNSEMSARLEAKTESLSEVNYALGIKQAEETLVGADLNIRKSKKDGFNVYNAIFNVNEYVYFSQVQKARDVVRISDLKALEMAVEQYYQDNGEYPTEENFEDSVGMYLYMFPEDPIGNVEKNGCKFGYIYEVGDDENGILNGAYKLSACFETNNSKVLNDGGTDDMRYEVGNDLSKIDFEENFYINGYTTWEEKEENTQNGSLNANLEVQIKEGGVDYEVPTNFEEYNISLDEMFVLPNISEFKKRSFLIGFGAGMLTSGVVGYFSFDKYMNSARDMQMIEKYK